MGQVVETAVDASGMRLAVVVARFNAEITDALVEGALDKITRSGGDAAGTPVLRVPGAFEIPLAAKWLCETGRYDAVVALGCVIRGGTPHFDYVCNEVSRGVTTVQLETGVPVAFGILTCDDLAQAQARSRSGPDNKGCEAAEAAIAMVRIRADLLGEKGGR